MLMKHYSLILRILGLLFIVLGISAYINSLDNGSPGQIFWFCYVALVLIGAGIFIKSPNIVLTQLNIMTIPLLVWVLDFFYVLIARETLFGITDYFFLPGPILGKIITSQHLFTIPLAIFSLYLIKIKRKDLWKFSFIEMSLIFLLSRLLTLEEYNINCVYMSCMNFSLGQSWFYPFWWFIIVFFMVFLTNYIFIRLKFLKNG